MDGKIVSYGFYFCKRNVIEILKNCSNSSKNLQKTEKYFKDVKGSKIYLNIFKAN